MFPFRKILLPVDYSEPCEAVVPYAKETASRFSADLTLVHAYGAEALAYSKLSLADPQLPREAKAFEQGRLEKYAQEKFPGLHVESFAQLGEAGTVIHDILESQGTDLVMLATHGRGPIRRLLLGSVAAKVLHDASAAVWTSTGSALASHAPEIPYKSVLCALDATDEAEGVLKAAAAFACAYQAQLSIVQVVEIVRTAPDLDPGVYQQDVLAAIDFRVRELKGQLGIDVPHAVIDAMVADGVRREAVRRKADLIIAGRGRAQAGLSRMWSNLYSIVRESPCPVLSI